jgi:hypothetical protein
MQVCCCIGVIALGHIEEKKEQAKKFKEYEPGYLHIDVTYLPKLEGKVDPISWSGKYRGRTGANNRTDGNE